MNTTLSDSSPLTDAASSAVSVVRDAFDQVPTDDLPDLSSIGDDIVDVVDAVGDVAVKSAGVIAGTATTITSKLNRTSILIGGAVVVGGLTAWALVQRRRASASSDTAGDETAATSPRLAAAS